MGITAAIVQARMGSTRLPGKVLMKLGRDTVLAHVLKRCQRIRGVDVVCCAVPETRDSDPVAEEAARCNVEVFRGSEHDVLDRYYRAAKALGAETILRVTSDCPLIDPEVCARVIGLLHEANADYACNNAPPSWPHGLDCEAFTFVALEQAALRASDSYDREHVTPWIRKNKQMRCVNLCGPEKAHAAMRWTIDYPEDLHFLESLFRRLASRDNAFSMQTILDILEDNPELGNINNIRFDPARFIHDESTVRRPDEQQYA